VVLHAIPDSNPRRIQNLEGQVYSRGKKCQNFCSSLAHW